MEAKIIDVCCGSRMFWYNRQHPETVYMDIRQFEDTLCDGRKLIVNPDVVGDFKDIPYPDNTFKLAVFDPPHLKSAGDNSWLVKKYGKLPADWKNEIKQGFDECMRVLQSYGILVFKWNQDQIKVKDIINAIGRPPLFGDIRSKTVWMVFMKGAS